MRDTILIVVAAAVSTGCYRYISVEDQLPLPEPGAVVRVQLAEPQPLELGSVTIQDVTRVEGDVYESNGETLGVFSREVFSAYGFKQYTNGAVFYFDRSQVGQLEQRKFLPVQSGIALGTLTVGVVAAMYFLLEAGGGAEDQGGKTDPVTSRSVGIPFGVIIP